MHWWHADGPKLTCNRIYRNYQVVRRSCPRTKRKCQSISLLLSQRSFSRFPLDQDLLLSKLRNFYRIDEPELKHNLNKMTSMLKSINVMLTVSFLPGLSQNSYSNFAITLDIAKNITILIFKWIFSKESKRYQYFSIASKKYQFFKSFSF